MSNELETPVASPDQQDDAAAFPPSPDEALNAVTLDDFLDEGEPVETQTEQDDAAAQDGTLPAEPDPSGQGDAEDPQISINKAIGQRLYAEREKLQRQFMQQYGEDLKLAQFAKKVLGENPQALLMRSEAMAYAQKHNVPEESALAIVRKNHGLPPERSGDEKGRFAAQQSLGNLVAQAQAIQTRDGVNMIDVLKSDAYLRERLHRDGWDINQAYGYHLARNASRERLPTPSAVRGGARPGVARSISRMTDREFRKMDDALGGGAVIKL